MVAAVSADYSTQFYNVIRDGCRASAAVVVPLLLEHYTPHTVIDVGCGEGWWGSEFAAAGGIEALGIDGDYVIDPVIPFKAIDIAQPLPDLGKFDLAVALEVAEHLPPERADGFVADLCQLAPVVLFSAAIPGQGGANHLNEQWPAYWVDRFKANGYVCSGDLRWPLWGDDRVEPWYQQNLVLAVADPATSPACLRFEDLFATPYAPVLPVVHPTIFDARRA